MDPNIKTYLRSGKHLPSFMRDFHDQKTLFKRLDELVQNPNNKRAEEMNWVAAQIYTIDFFLWYMAYHGYTLQKSRKKIPFCDIYDDLKYFDNRMREESVEMLKNLTSRTEHNTNNKEPQ